MSIVAKELIKVFTNKSVLFIFTLLIVLNGALLYVNEYTADLSYQPSAYKELHQDIKGLSNEDVLDKLEADYNELSFYLELMIDQNINSSQDSLIERYTDLDVPSLVEKYNNNSYLKYTDNYFFETELYRQVLEDANGIVNYDAYLKKIDDDAKIMTSVSIFVKPDTFAYRNIKKTPLDFSHLKGNRLSIDTSKGLKLATESLTTDIIALVLILAVCMTLITKEKEQDCLNLAKTTYRGRRPLAASKLVVAFISCAFIGLMLYSVNFAFGYFAYGFGDLGRYIQSLSGYIGSALNITVFQYLVLFLIAKLLVYMLISLIVLTVSILVNSSIGVYIVNVVIFGLSGILYYTIPATSVFSVFKYINIIAFLDTFKLFASYRNLNFFAMPVNYIPCFILAVVAGLVLLSAISIALFSKQKSIRIAARPVEFIRERLSRRKIFKSYKTVNVFVHELYKILISNKVLLVLLIFALVQIYSYQPSKESFRSIDDIHYKNYMLQLEGELTAEKEQFIAGEEKRFEDLMDEMQRLDGQEDSIRKISELGKALGPQNGFERVLDQYDYLKTIKEESGLNGWFLYDSGYKLLTADQSNQKDLQLALILAIVIIASLSSVFALDFQTGMVNIISPTRQGRKKLLYSKILISTLIAISIYALVYLPEIIGVLRAYGTLAIGAPAYSMPHLSKLRLGLTIRQYLILVSILRFIGTLAGMMLVFALSAKLRSLISTTLASTAILVLPMLFSLLNIRLFDYILLTPLLSGNILFKGYGIGLLEQNRQVYMAIALLFTIGIIIFAGCYTAWQFARNRN